MRSPHQALQHLYSTIRSPEWKIHSKHSRGCRITRPRALRAWIRYFRRHCTPHPHRRPIWAAAGSISWEQSFKIRRRTCIHSSLNIHWLVSDDCTQRSDCLFDAHLVFSFFRRRCCHLCNVETHWPLCKGQWRGFGASFGSYAVASCCCNGTTCSFGPCWLCWRLERTLLWTIGIGCIAHLLDSVLCIGCEKWIQPIGHIPCRLFAWRYFMPLDFGNSHWILSVSGENFLLAFILQFVN